LIIGVLLLLMVLPAITYSQADISHNYGLKQLFWFGRSDCHLIKGSFDCEKNGWITEEGWKE